MTEFRPPYPVRVDAAPDPSVSRWLWLVKWLLLIPHYVVLAFLWLAFVVVSVLAFFAILFTGRYPRSLFDFNVGVLRWSWRVHYYGYAALGTDRYPPFTLADVPEYPAHFEVPFPDRLSRGLVLVKWWLLAIPHYVVLAIFIGGGVWLGSRDSSSNGVWTTTWGAGGLVGLLVLIAALVLLFTGRYPRPIYDFVLGMDRWALRVAAYVGLMTDRYPPFRLDMGGIDPGAVPTALPPPFPPGGSAVAQPVGGPAPASAAAPAAPPAAGRQHSWTAGRVVALVVGSVLLFAAAGCLVGGGTLLWADRTQRSGGYLSTPEARVATAGHAVTSDSFRLEGGGLDWTVDNVLGSARVAVTPTDPAAELFVGIARADAASRYLTDVGYTQVDALGLPGRPGQVNASTTTEHAGGAPATPPDGAGIWTASSSGAGTRVVTWRPSAGDWTVVVMRADGGAGLTADVRAGATLPALGWIAVAVLGVGVVLMVIGGLIVGLAVHRAAQLPPGAVAAGGGPPAPAGPGAEPVLTGRPNR